MGDRNNNHDLYAFLGGETLKVDGSNFIDWYLRLRAMLKRRDALHVIQEHVGNPPGDSADEQEVDDFRDRRELFFLIKYTMIYSMAVELRMHFDDTSAYDIIDELKPMFIS